MTDRLSVMRGSLNRLHFEEAAAQLGELEKQSLTAEETFELQLLKARLARGLYRNQEALAAAEKAQALAESPKQQERALLEAARGLHGTGKSHQGLEMLEKHLLHHPQARPDLLFYWLFLLAENGRVQEAQESVPELNRRLETERFENSMAEVEWLSFQGDLASYLEKPQEAVHYYQLARAKVDAFIPENWRPLRQAILYQNLADTREQEEAFSLALEAYETARTYLKEQEKRDPELSDLSGYWLELLLSLANMYAFSDAYEKADQVLEEARERLESRPPRQKDYYTSRWLFYSGLNDLYKGDADSREAARKKLKQAWAMQSELVARGKDKKEHLGKTAYYLQSLLPDAPEYRKEQHELTLQAMEIFEELKEKDPAFYLSGLAGLWNDLGRLESEPAKALLAYEQSASAYQAYLQRYPADSFARQSLCIAWMNTLEPLRRSGQDKRLQAREKELEALLGQLAEENPEFVLSILPSLRAEPLAEGFLEELEGLEEQLEAQLLAA